MQVRAIFAIFLSLFVVACSGSDGTDGVDGNSVLVESSDAATEDCAAGGTILTFGYDTTGDGAIDDVLTTETLCEGADGEAGEDGNSVLTETAPAGTADCPNGGTTVILGYDTTGDGAIDNVLETVDVCDGAPGEDGMPVLVETAPASATDCPAGGTTATFGYDTTGDGAIDQPLNTTVVCDGEDGADGDPILVESAAAATGACPASGTTFTFGYDTTGDGSIDQTVDTTTICDGEQGAPGDELTVEQTPATSCQIGGGTTFTFGYDTTGDGSIDTVVETISICNSTLESTIRGSEVLYYNDNVGSGDTFLAALQSLDTAGTINLTVTTTPDTEIGTGNYDIVVFNRSDGSITTAEETALTTWINGGGATIFTHWTATAPILATFEATATSSALSTANFSGVLGTDLGPVAVSNPFGWGTYSLDLTPTGTATSSCTWSAGGSCAVVGNGGKTVVLGFMMDTISQADADLLMRNSLAQVVQ